MRKNTIQQYPLSVKKSRHISPLLYSIKPLAAELRDGKLWVTLADGRTIAAPLESYPILAKAAPDQQAHIVFSEEGLHWPDIDEDISVPGMLRACDGYVESLEAVATVKEISEEYGISRFTILDAIRHNWLPARKSGGTYLIRWRDANERWGAAS